MRKIAGRELWIGNAGDLRDPRALFAAGVEAIVELADNEPFASLPRELIRCRFPLSDSGASANWLLRLAVDTVVDFLKARVPTLVCCSGGQNRSVCVAAAAVAIADARSFDEALFSIASGGHADVSPGLLAQMRASLAS